MLNGDKVTPEMSGTLTTFQKLYLNQEPEILSKHFNIPTLDPPMSVVFSNNRLQQEKDYNKPPSSMGQAEAVIPIRVNGMFQNKDLVAESIPADEVLTPRQLDSHFPFNSQFLTQTSATMISQDQNQP